MKKIILSTIIVLSNLITTVSQASDIIGTHSNLSIKVERKDQDRRFSLCNREKQTCKTLGNQEWYSVNDLEMQRYTEGAQAVISTVGTAGIAILSFYGAAFLGMFTTTDAIVGVGAAGGVVTGTAFSITDLGPIEQWKQQYLLRSDVINDAEVTLSGATDEDIREIAARLTTLLNK